MTKSNKQDELAEAFLEWADEDPDDRVLFIVSGCCGHANLVRVGNERKLLRALIATILDDDDTQEFLFAALDGEETVQEAKRNIFKGKN